MRAANLGLAVLLLSGCAQQKPLYSGLNRDSFGPLTNYVDSQTNVSISPPPCDPDEKYSDVNELSRRITAGIMSPLSGGSKIDETLIKEDLQSHFLMPGDPSGQPLVAILDRNADGIVFWYMGSLVVLKEVTGAATDYCQRQGKTAVYQGSSRKCSEPKIMPIAVNGKRTSIDTYVISSFACAGSAPTLVAASLAPPPTPNYDLAFVRSVQLELVRLKLLNGPADGAYGPKTKAAIMTFQKSKGIVADGLPTKPLLDALKSS